MQLACPCGHSQLPLGLSLARPGCADSGPAAQLACSLSQKDSHGHGAAPGAATSPLSRRVRLRFSKESRGREPPHPVKEQRRSPLWGTGADFAKAGSARKGEAVRSGPSRRAERVSRISAVAGSAAGLSWCRQPAACTCGLAGGINPPPTVLLPPLPFLLPCASHRLPAASRKPH